MSEPLPPNPAYQRDFQVERLSSGEPFDMLVIGGGATGVGIAVDAASRGFRVALCEQNDFGKGTSSRSTKLVHGGVRYLEQGNVKLVREALHERGLLLRTRRTSSILCPPWCRSIAPRRALLLDGAQGLRPARRELRIGRSKYLSARKAAAAIPTLKRNGLAAAFGTSMRASTTRGCW